jgi:uncharacterized protein (TIGR00251 family)
MELEDFLAKSREILQKEGILYLSLKIIPNSQITKFAELMQGEEDVLKIRVAAIPEKGKANKEIIRFLKKEFSAKKVEIVLGVVSVQKLVKIQL